MAEPDKNAWKLIRNIQQSGLNEPTREHRNYNALPHHDGSTIETPDPVRRRKHDISREPSTNPIKWGWLFWPVITFVLLFSTANLWMDYDIQSKAAFLTISSMIFLAGILQLIQTKAFIHRSETESLAIRKQLENLEDRTWELQESEER